MFSMARLTVIAIATVVLSGTAFAAGKIPIFVSIVPQKDFVQQIGKGLVDVQVMVPPGASPHIYEPKPAQMIAVAKARLYFAIGVGYEKAWLPKIAAVNPQMRVVHTDHGIRKIPMQAHHHEEDAHHEEAEHAAEQGRSTMTDEDALASHPHKGGQPDPHIWLSPPLVMTQARTILGVLQAVDPAHRALYEDNYNAFISRIVQLDRELRDLFSGRQGLQFMVFHPAWGYFAHAYGLRQVPIELEGKDPKPAELQGLIEHARGSGIRVIFVQPQFSTKSAALVAKAIGGQVVFADPLAADWFANLRQVADKFNAALKP
jgi:zinc transport system substrate-binding protein